MCMGVHATNLFYFRGVVGGIYFFTHYEVFSNTTSDT